MQLQPVHRRLSRSDRRIQVGRHAVQILVEQVGVHIEPHRRLGVPEHPWAAAAILPTGVLWMLLSMQRGALQGLHAYQALGYSLIGEAGINPDLLATRIEAATDMLADSAESAMLHVHPDDVEMSVSVAAGGSSASGRLHRRSPLLMIT